MAKVADIKKNRLSDAKFKQLLFKECNKSDSKGHIKSNFYELIRTKYQVAKQRSLQLHDIYYKEWQELNQKATNDTTTSEIKEAVKNGLKSKIERTLNLQSQIEFLQNKLNSNTTTDLIIVKGYPEETSRALSINEIVQLAKAIKELTALIGTNEGDAAPTKTAQTTADGKDISPIDLSVLPTDVLKLILAATKK